MSPPRSFASQVVVLPGGYWSWRPRRINMDKPYQHIVTKTTHKTHIYTTMLISSNTTKYHILSHDYLGIGLCTICICIIYGVLHTYIIYHISIWMHHRFASSQQQLHEQHMPGAMAPPESACWAPSLASPDRRNGWKWCPLDPLCSFSWGSH